MFKFIFINLVVLLTLNHVQAASSDLNNDKFVAVIEYGFSQQYLQSIADNILDLQGVVPICNGFSKIKKTGERSEGHGDRVIRSFLLNNDGGVKVLPLQVRAYTSSFWNVFECLRTLANSGNLLGVNISIALQDTMNDRPYAALYDEDLKNIYSFISKMKSKNTSITVAAGNTTDRLEDMFIFPASGFCNSKWDNVYCVTTLEIPTHTKFSDDSDDRMYEYWNLRIPAWGPIGSQSHPRFVKHRYSSQANMIAVPLQEINYTSFVAPTVLAKLVGFGLETRTEYAFVLKARRQEGLDLIQVNVMQNSYLKAY